MPPSSCPDPKELQRFLLGLIEPGDAESARLEKHLSQCKACDQTAEALKTDDTFVEALRAVQALGGDKPEKDVVEGLVAKLRGLKPAASVPVSEMTAATLPPDASSSSESVPREHYDFLAPPQGPGELGRLGPYRVLKVLGAGGMGVVFQAEDPQLKRVVALKAMKPALAASDSARKRFLREAQTTASIEHDHIVAIYQVGEDRGVPYLAMPFLKGEPLDDRLKREGKLPILEVLRIGREVAEGLAAAHERGLIHRDIKPGNIWLESKSELGTRSVEPQKASSAFRAPRSALGRVKILDFGLARAAREETHLTQTGAIVGTPSYMAPEQARGGEADPRFDLYSLGCVLYKMCTGDVPFKGTDTLALLMAHAIETPKSPRELNPDLPPELSDLILKLLAKEPKERPATAHAVVEMIEAIERQEQERTQMLAPPSGRPRTAVAGSPLPLVGEGQGVRGKPRRRRAWIGTLAGIAALLLIGLGFLGYTIYQAATTVRIPTDKGDLVIETDSAEVEVVVKNQSGTIIDNCNKRVIELTPGDYGIEVKIKDESGETRFITKQVTIKKGDKTVVDARIEVAKATPAPGANTPGSPLLGSGVVPLDALRRENIPPADLAEAGGGDPQKASPRLVAVLSGKDIHGAGLAFSPDGKLLAQSGPDQSVKLWDLTAGPSQRVLIGHAKWVRALAFSPDGKLLASASSDNTVRLWDVATNKAIATLEGHNDSVTNVAFSPDGKILASSSSVKDGECEIKLWDVGTQKELRTLKGPGGAGNQRRTPLAFTPDGKWLVSAHGDGTVKLWATGTWEERTICRMPGSAIQPAAILSMSMSADGKLLAAGDQAGNSVVYDVTTGQERHKFLREAGGGVSGVALSPDGKMLAMTKPHPLRIWDLAAGKSSDENPLGSSNVMNCLFSPEGRHVATVNADGTVYILRLAPPAEPGGLRPPLAKPLPDKEKPFVLVHANGQREEFQTLAGALGILQNGDVIEVHGNGPFKLGWVQLKSKGLTIKAAPGYRPQFSASDDVFSAPGTRNKPAWFDVQGGALFIEGCDLRCPPLVPAFNGGGAPWEFRNCRIIKAGRLAGNLIGLVTYIGPKLRFADCLISTTDQCTAIQIGPKTEFELSNSLVRTFYAGEFVLLQAAGGQTLRFLNSTLVTNGPVLVLGTPKDVTTEPVSVEATGNLFYKDGPAPRWVFIAPQEKLKELFRWQGKDNLYAGPTVMNIRNATNNDAVYLANLAEWNKFWGKDEAGSRETKETLFGWDEVYQQDSLAALQTLKRVTDELRQRPGFADLGPDWDLVGPGDAYVRALQAEGKPVPKDRPEALTAGPFVILHEGKEPKGYKTLQLAVAAAVDGDTVEIRTNGPFPGGTRQRLANGATITVRAAVGYRPVLEGDLGFGELDTAIVEGLHFRKGGIIGGLPSRGRIARLANCSFEQYEPINEQRPAAVQAAVPTADKGPVEIVNCLIPGMVQVTGMDGQKLRIRNSVVGTLRTHPFDQLEVTRCVIWNPGLGAPNTRMGPPHAFSFRSDKTVITATATLFETGGGMGYEVKGWTGSRNVYHVGHRDWFQDAALVKTNPTIGLEGWRQFWKSDADSIEGNPLDHEPLAWRLLPGQAKRPDGRDYGAEVEKVARTAAP